MSHVLRLETSPCSGGVVAINDLSMHIDQEIVALIGPNGAGKTTASTASPEYTSPPTALYFNDQCIVRNQPTGRMKNCTPGTTDPCEGHARYDPGQDHKLGIARTFQNIRLFKSQSAFENVLIGMPQAPAIPSPLLSA